MKKATDTVNSAMQLVEQVRRKSYLHERGIDPNKSTKLQLDLVFDGMIHDNERFLPNDYARSALFTARNKREPRRALQSASIYHLHNAVTISYTGIELRAYDDELVWLQILYYGAKRAPLGDSFSFTVGELVQDLDWPRTGFYYDCVRKSISRLKATEIQINNEQAYGNGLAQSLIKHYEFDNDGKGKPQRYTVWIDRDLIFLLAGKTFTTHNWQRYRQYSPIARRLVDYIGSNRHPHPLTLENFAKICDTKCKTKDKWRQMADEACQEVKGKDAKDIRIDGNKIYIVR